MDTSLKPNDAELSAPSSEPVKWAGWPRSNPNRVGRATAKLWYDARDIIARDIGTTNVFEIEVVRVEEF